MPKAGIKCCTLNSHYKLSSHVATLYTPPLKEKYMSKVSKATDIPVILCMNYNNTKSVNYRF